MSNEEIVKEIQSGHNVQENMSLLYKKNKGLIYRVACKYQGYENIEDLQQQAYIGLHEAVQSYRPEQETRFSTYAYTVIQRELRSYLEDCCFGIRIPQNEKQLLYKYRKAVEQYRTKYNQFPATSELRYLLKLPSEKINELKCENTMQSIESIYMPLQSTDDKGTLIDTIPDQHDFCAEVEDSVFDKELSAYLWSFVAELDKVLRDTIIYKYRHGMTFKEIAEKMRCSENTVKCREGKALRLLRKPESIKRLKAYLDYETAYTLGLQGTSLNSFRKTHTSSVERAVLIGLNEEEKRI